MKARRVQVINIRIAGEANAGSSSITCKALVLRKCPTISAGAITCGRDRRMVGRYESARRCACCGDSRVELQVDLGRTGLCLPLPWLHEPMASHLVVASVISHHQPQSPYCSPLA
jgi:hypothetical protein